MGSTLIGHGRAQIRLTAQDAPLTDRPAVDAYMDGDGADQGFALMSDAGTLRAFVQFAGVAPGMAVVEVGAGTGRLTFEGGLADRVGGEGVLLATDPAPALLAVVDRKRRERRAEHVYTRRAEAEHLPVDPAQAEVVLGSKFLQHCDREAAVREMRRVCRPGGTVAVLAAVAGGQVPPILGRAIAPLLSALAAAGASAPDPYRMYHRAGEVPALFAAAGLEDVRSEPHTEQAELADPDATMRFCSQLSLLEGLVEPLPPLTQQILLDRAYTDLRAELERAPRSDRAGSYCWEFVRGRCPLTPPPA
jgi:SAM-dependent methyltransferase